MHKCIDADLFICVYVFIEATAHAKQRGMKMAVLTAQVVHNRNWMTCPRCDGGKAFTAKDLREGAQCTYCDTRGEVPRFAPRPRSDDYKYSTLHERQAGA